MNGLGPLPPPTVEAPAQVTKVAASLLIPARNSGESLRNTVLEAAEALGKLYGDAFEIILIPNPAKKDDPSLEISESLAKQYGRVRVVPHFGVRGKGAALRTGFAASRGAEIYFTDADLPYDLKFIAEARARLAAGDSFVTGNRRLPESEFSVPVDLLRLAYRRHRLGLRFNRVARFLLRLPTTDTQAGIKGMSRALAQEAFSRQSCPGFFFDLEFFLTARRSGFSHSEIPVTLYLNSEKSTVRLIRESWLAAFWLTRISWQNLRGRYGKLKTAAPKVNGILRLYRRDSSLGAGTRLFLAARWYLTPYRDMARELSPRGRVLDLGCGHGFLALTAALSSAERQVRAVDHDEARISSAQKAAAGIRNLAFEAGNLLESLAPTGHYSGVTLIDVMHYFPESLQKEVTQKTFDALQPGGRFLVREVDPEGGVIASWNRLYEKIATQTGFTKANPAHSSSLHFRTRSGWESFFSSFGFKVTSRPCSSPLFADVLFICERPE